MEERFGYAGEELGAGERLCTESVIASAVYLKVIHPVVRELPGGDVECERCGARFLGEAKAAW